MKVTVFIALKSFMPNQLPDYNTLQILQKNVERNLYSDSASIERVDAKRIKSSNIVALPLPQKQSTYTVLRSPHIDKKSRDQFALQVHKRLIIIRTEIKELRKKLFNLKFHGLPGVQMKIIFHTKTRLNFSSFLSNVIEKKETKNEYGKVILEEKSI